MKKSFSILISFLGLVLFSCEKDAPIGPNIETLYGELRIDSPFGHDKGAGVDFNSGAVNFTGQFSITTPWTITIIGRTSGAVKTITGNSNNLSASGINWDGFADNLFFKVEMADIVMTFDSFDDTLRDSVNITNGPDLTTLGTLLTDFESGAPNYVTVSGSGTTAQNRLNTPLTAPEGDYYFEAAGTDAGSDFWLGAIRWTNIISITETDASQIYVNAYMYGMNLPNTRAVFKTGEDEDSNMTIDESWKYQIDIETPGWQLVSFPMSDMVIDGAASNSTLEPEKTYQIDFTCGSNGSPGNYGYYVDFIIITIGAPL